ncbi:hypothetical protein FOE78_07045 [Microlunatus elymi]|uniref:DUF222 domain-containing protein n=1 Tax=Microlunatus elymi TaxID=2596828 RepID=A0A516PWY7_9ACTN|nr:hypothetical protein [Microlunatus elymi]QDP95694.1 hypothetical protein FOE78_07045 [Microlunatus elymi]
MIQEPDTTRELAGRFHDRVRDEIMAQNDQLIIAALWADQHPPDGLPRTGAVSLVAERAVRPGGEGTPEVAEFAAAELAPEGGISVGAAKALIADVLDLRHRLPLIWRLVQTGQVRAWVARRVAVQTRHLSLAQAGRADQLLAAAIQGPIGPVRLDNRIKAALLTVDAEHMAQLAAQALRMRGVWVGQSNTDGVTEVVLRMDAPGAIALKARIDQLARILMHAPEPIPGVPDRNPQSFDEWQAVAAEVAANSLLAAKILIEHDQPDLFDAFADLYAPPASHARGPHETPPDRYPANEADLAPTDPGREAPDPDEPPLPEDLPPDDADLLDDPNAGDSGQGSDDHDHAAGAYDSGPSTGSGTDGSATDDHGRPRPGDRPPASGDRRSAHHPPGRQALPAAFDSELRDAYRDQALRALLRALDPRRLATPVTLHVHCTADGLARQPATTAAGMGRPAVVRQARVPNREVQDAPIARIEEIGPVLLDQVRAWFGSGAVIDLQPVIDVAGIQPVDAYEVPAAMREALFLRTPASAFPYSNQVNRAMDADHTIPYRREPNPAGQTGLQNLGLLGRAEHRFKTHGRIAIRQPVPGTYLWRTFTGRVIVVNDTGTHDLGINTFADTIWQAARRPAA